MAGGFELGPIKIPAVSDQGRKALGWLGSVFLVISAVVYIGLIFGWIDPDIVRAMRTLDESGFDVSDLEQQLSDEG